MQPSQPEPPSPNGELPALDRALELVRFLRANCPWDAAQTSRSLLPYLLEEAHEVAEAVARGDDEPLVEELGDLLLNLAFQIVVAEERSAFDAEAVVRRLEEKMRRRHPHLYGLGPAQGWEALKATERLGQPPESILDGVSGSLDPLARAEEIQRRVSTVGFDWADPAGAWEKVQEELQEVSAAASAPAMEELEEELGDLVFAVVNFARLRGVSAPLALRQANRKFAGRFRALEALAEERGIVLESAGLDQLDTLWEEVKRAERLRGKAG